jgi:drug/metabolite transporter (DMT)-like permease
MKRILFPTTISKVRAYLTLFLLSLIWGTSFILIKKGLSVFPPEQVASLRMGLSGVIFLPFMWLQFRKFNWKRVHWIIFVGLTSSTIPAFLFANAQLHISSSMAGILNSLTPLFTLFLGILFFKFPFAWLKMLGVLLGLSGAYLLLTQGKIFVPEGEIRWGFLIVLAALLYGTGTNVVGTKLKDIPSFQISIYSFGLTGVPLFIYLLGFTNFTETISVHPGAWQAVGYIFFLSLVSTVLASIIFFELIQHTSPLFGSTVAYLMPMVAMMWGFIDGEDMGWWNFAGMVLILSGVYLSRSR